MDDMRPNLPTPLRVLILGASIGAALAGCGSQTKTVSVAGAPAVTQSTTSSTQASTATTTTTPTQTTTTSTAPTSSNGGSEAPSTTHSAPEPAFTQQEAHTEGLSEAVSVLRARGYTPNEASQYHASQTLRVLIGSNGSSGQQAFFFLNGRYLGTDTKEPSAAVKVIAQSDTEVTLSYPLYRPTDPPSSPSGGQAVVHFQLNNGKLTSLDPIPPAKSSTGLSRN
jgi:hypothetical protein